MDTFINLAKEGYSTYESMEGQGQNQGEQQQQGGYQQNQGEPQYNIQGGAQWNSPDNQPPGGNLQGSGGQPNINQQAAVQQAQSHAGGSGDSGLFSEALSFVQNSPGQHTQPIDEGQVQDAHNQAYAQGNASNLDASSMGGAAALQILKQFTGGGGASGGGNSQTQLISSAMGEAAKLFDASGGGTGGSKQDAVNSAAMTVMKLLVQSKFSGLMGGGNSGGLGSMMSMASQLL